jgi:hypothetical protein
MTGISTDNGSPVTFTLVAVDSLAAPGFFSIVLSDGDTNTGALISGSNQQRGNSA